MAGALCRENRSGVTQSKGPGEQKVCGTLCEGGQSTSCQEPCGGRGNKVARVLHVRDEGTEGVRGSFNREAVEGSAEGWGRRI